LAIHLAIHDLFHYFCDAFIASKHRHIFRAQTVAQALERAYEVDQRTRAKLYCPAK